MTPLKLAILSGKYDVTALLRSVGTVEDERELSELGRRWLSDARRR